MIFDGRSFSLHTPKSYEVLSFMVWKLTKEHELFEMVDAFPSQAGHIILLSPSSDKDTHHASSDPRLSLKTFVVLKLR